MVPGDHIKDEHRVVADERSARFRHDGGRAHASLLADLLHSADDAAGIVLQVQCLIQLYTHECRKVAASWDAQPPHAHSASGLLTSVTLLAPKTAGKPQGTESSLNNHGTFMFKLCYQWLQHVCNVFAMRNTKAKASPGW